MTKRAISHSALKPDEDDNTASGGALLLEALHRNGVEYIFANFGSDHPAIIEALSQTKASGVPVPKVITCPTEMVALSAAQGYAQITGKAQAVIVHVDCGTQSLGGAVHNAARGRSPVLIFAGTSPHTQEGELKGSRNEFIHWIQDTSDQRGLVRGYVKYDNEIRSSRNIAQIVSRAMQIAHSEPSGPVYLTEPREVLEETAPLSKTTVGTALRATEPTALPDNMVNAIVEDLSTAGRPLIVTSYVGRKPSAVPLLVELAEILSIPVIESAPMWMNFPHDHPLYQGNQWNEPAQNDLLAEADCILVLDSDVPWIPVVNRPNNTARIYHLDVDALKLQIPLWDIGPYRTSTADSETALRQIVTLLKASKPEGPRLAQRRREMEERHARRLADLEKAEALDETITAAALTSELRKFVDQDTFVFNEGISNYRTIFDHLRMNSPGTMFASGGGSLGWNGGAAIGAKLASPDATIFALTGDGSFLFSAPSAVHWMANRYGTPFLQVVYNNGGWKAPKLSTLAVHPDGFASQDDDLNLSFAPSPNYGAIAAAAGGAWFKQVKSGSELRSAIQEAVNEVRGNRRCAVLDVFVAP